MTLLALPDRNAKLHDLLNSARDHDKQGRKDLALFDFNAACAWSLVYRPDIYWEMKAAAHRYRTQYLATRRQ